MKKVTYIVISPDGSQRMEKKLLDDVLYMKDDFVDNDGNTWELSSHDRFTVQQYRKIKLNSMRTSYAFQLKSYPVELSGDMANQFNESFYNDDI